jgi:hypothetical protein
MVEGALEQPGRRVGPGELGAAGVLAAEGAEEIVRRASSRGTHALGSGAAGVSVSG